MQAACDKKVTFLTPLPVTGILSKEKRTDYPRHCSTLHLFNGLATGHCGKGGSGRTELYVGKEEVAGRPQELCSVDC